MRWGGRASEVLAHGSHLKVLELGERHPISVNNFGHEYESYVQRMDEGR